MRARRALLDAAHVQRGRRELHLVPAKIRKLRHAQTVAIGDEVHGGVAMAMSIAFGGLGQALHLIVG